MSFPVKTALAGKSDPGPHGFVLLHPSAGILASGCKRESLNSTPILVCLDKKVNLGACFC